MEICDKKTFEIISHEKIILPFSSNSVIAISAWIGCLLGGNGIFIKIMRNIPNNYQNGARGCEKERERERKRLISFSFHCHFHSRFPSHGFLLLFLIHNLFFSHSNLTPMIFRFYYSFTLSHTKTHCFLINKSLTLPLSHTTTPLTHPLIKFPHNLTSNLSSTIQISPDICPS